MVTVTIRFDGTAVATKETLTNAFEYAKALTASFKRPRTEPQIEWSIFLYRHGSTRLIEVASDKWTEESARIRKEYLAVISNVRQVEHFEIRINVKRHTDLSKAFEAAQSHGEGLVVAMKTKWVRIL